jgi:hypothetical protein
MTTKAQILGVATLVATASSSQAQTTPQAAAPAPPLSPTEQTIKDIKNPTSWMSWGADFRVRNEYFDNLLTLNPNNPLHEQDYFRFRARIWSSVKPVENLSLNVRVAAEAREWMKPAGYTPMRGRQGWDWSEGIIDNLNVQWKNIAGLPASLTVGRQDIFFGDGWLMGDGTPYDGSWTYFLDAARFTYELKDQHTVIEAMGIMQDPRDDAWLPPIAGSDQDRIFTEQREQGAVLSIANSSMKAANITGYFIYKRDDAMHPPVAGSDNADIYTLGARFTGLLGNNWKYWAEGAYQFGEKQDVKVRDESAPAGGSGEYRDIEALGINTKLTYMFKDKLNNQVSLAYEFLSGDDPGSGGTDEMFDVLWGRWPHWSEIGLYSYAAETRVGQQANLHRIGPIWSLTPFKNVDFIASYFALFTQEQAATRGAAGLFSNDGNFRGHFVSGVVKYKFNQRLSGHLWGECNFPGDYYVHQKPMTFLRAELLLTF